MRMDLNEFASNKGNNGYNKVWLWFLTYNNRYIISVCTQNSQALGLIKLANL